KSKPEQPPAMSCCLVAIQPRRIDAVSGSTMLPVSVRQPSAQRVVETSVACIIQEMLWRTRLIGCLCTQHHHQPNQPRALLNDERKRREGYGTWCRARAASVMLPESDG